MTNSTAPSEWAIKLKATQPVSSATLLEQKNVPGTRFLGRTVSGEDAIEHDMNNAGIKDAGWHAACTVVLRPGRHRPVWTAAAVLIGRSHISPGPNKPLRDVQRNRRAADWARRARCPTGPGCNSTHERPGSCTLRAPLGSGFCCHQSIQLRTFVFHILRFVAFFCPLSMPLIHTRNS
ncbi:hypothetical protein VTN96DRAFT_1024 [Rasamsonia emersonii]